MAVARAYVRRTDKAPTTTKETPVKHLVKQNRLCSLAPISGPLPQSIRLYANVRISPGKWLLGLHLYVKQQLLAALIQYAK